MVSKLGKEQEERGDRLEAGRGTRVRTPWRSGYSHVPIVSPHIKARETARRQERRRH